MVLKSYFFKIEAKQLKYIKPHSNLINISLGNPMVQMEDNYTIHDLICRFRDDLWLSYHSCPAKLLNMKQLSTINNLLLEDYDTMDNDDQEYIDKTIEIIDQLADTIDYEDRIAYVWFRS